jgi:hypothetical protein
MATEMREMKQALNQQTLALDTLATELRKAHSLPPSEPLSVRLRQD